MNGKRGAVVLFALIAGAASSALAGPDWVEGGEDDGNFLPDAGSLPGSAQPITGGGPVGSISGRLSGPTEGVGGDFEDMYLLQIDDFGNFFINSDPMIYVPEGEFLFDISLFLFTGPDHPAGEGLGLLANQNCDDCLFGAAALGNQATDGSQGPMLISGLTYYLAIAGDGRFPVDALGNPIFFFGSDPFEVSGPDGEGGFNPIAGWAGDGLFGEYFIPEMLGTSAVPTPGGAALFGLAALGALRRRR